MSTVLTNGIIIPDNGNRNWGGDLANNWNIIDLNVGYMNDVKNRVTTLETSVAENTANIQTNASNISALQTSKQDALSDQQIANIADVTNKANIADTVLKTNTDYTFRNYALNSLNIDEKYNENYVVGISDDVYGTRPVDGWTNIINFCTYHFITQLCIPIHPNKDTDCMYIRTRWSNDTTWGEWRKSANDNDVVHKSGNETVNGIKNFNDVVLGEVSGQIRIGNNGEGALFCNLAYDGRIYNNSKQFVPNTNDEYNLGTSTNKWKTINGINPGALSLPNVAEYVDVTSQIVNNDGVYQYTNNLYDGLLVVTAIADQARISNQAFECRGVRSTDTAVTVHIALRLNETVNMLFVNFTKFAYVELFKCIGNV